MDAGPEVYLTKAVAQTEEKVIQQDFLWISPGHRNLTEVGILWGPITMTPKS